MIYDNLGAAAVSAMIPRLRTSRGSVGFEILVSHVHVVSGS